MTTTVKIGGIEVTKWPKHPTLQHLVPTVAEDPHGYESQGREMQALAAGDKYGRPVLLIGDTGTGKNAAIREYARLTNRPLINISLAAGTTSDQFIGVPMPASGEKGFNVTWRDGALPTALKAGAILNLDELNAGDARTLMRLHDFAANDYALNVYENPESSGLEVIKPQPGFMLVATMNPHDSGKYTGTNTLNEATLDRFLVAYLDYLGVLDLDREVNLVSRAAKIKVGRARRIVNVMNTIRMRSRMSDADIAGKDIQPIYATASTRKAIDIALLSKDLPIMAAVEIAFSNKINPDDQPVIQKLFLDQFAAAVEGDDDE